MKVKVRQRNDLSGKQFGRVHVFSPTTIKRGKLHWLCRCDCGVPLELSGLWIVSGKASCGCIKRERLEARRAAAKAEGKPPQYWRRYRAYHTWYSMLDRCENPKCRGYPDYGGRGIKVCEAWHTFENFFRDMGERPDGLSLDRIDNNGNYEPANCRWATMKMQARNRRNSIVILEDGARTPLCEYAARAGLPRARVMEMIRDGQLTAERAAYSAPTP